MVRLRNDKSAPGAASTPAPSGQSVILCCLPWLGSAGLTYSHWKMSARAELAKARSANIEMMICSIRRRRFRFCMADLVFLEHVTKIGFVAGLRRFAPHPGRQRRERELRAVVLQCKQPCFAARAKRARRSGVGR